MLTTDRIAGNYHLETLRTPPSQGDMFITLAEGYGNLVIRGNLTVIGGTSVIESVQSVFYDNELVFNADVTNIIPYEDVGISVRRGTSPNVFLKWNEYVDWWEFSASYPTRYNTLSKQDPSDDLFTMYKIMRFIRDDMNPHLGGHLYTDTYDIRSYDPLNVILTPGWNGVRANTGIQISHVDSSVANVSYVIGSTVFYAKQPGEGNSGLFVIDKKQRSEELVTKRKSLIYSLVL